MSKLSDIIDGIDNILEGNDPKHYPPNQADMTELLVEMARAVERQGILLDNIDANTVKKYVKR